MNDVPSGSSIMKEVRNRNMVEPGSLPFLFGVLSRGNNYFGHGIFTTELGAWGSDTIDYMLQLLAGAHTYDTSYVSFYRPRQLCFLEGNKGTFIYGESYTRFINDSFSSNYQIYEYPYVALGVIFIKNTTSISINETINFVGSSGGLEKAGLFVGTPDTNKSRVTWKNIYKYIDRSSQFAASGNVEIPGGKTIAVLLCTSSYPHSDMKISEGVLLGGTYKTYGQFIQWGIYNIRSNFLTTGLEVDVERTLKAWQCPGLDATYKIWN